MTQDLESVMKNALDGKFYSYSYNDAGGMKVIGREVSKHFFPKYEPAKQPVESSRQGGMTRAAQHRARVEAFWTPEKVASLKALRSEDISARRIGRLLGICRYEVGKKLNSLGMLNRYGERYNVTR
jgi:hypothetical protein